MKKIAVIYIFLSLSRYSYSQQFYFPQKLYSDSATLAKAMRNLAKQVLATYSDTNKMNFYDNAFRYQLVAQNYSQSIALIDSLRKPISRGPFSKATGIQFEAYAYAKNLQKRDTASFEQAFKKAYNLLYDKLPATSKIAVSSYFDIANIKSSTDSWHQLTSDLKNKKGDSITFKEAQELCRAYNSYIVYNTVIPLAKPLLMEFYTDDNLPIPLRGGLKLSAIVAYPKNIKLPLPVILMVSCYPSKEKRELQPAKMIASGGYACVTVFPRGKAESEGIFYPWENDAQDNYDIIDWISKQSWCNGKIGMFGGSYLGFTQWAATKKLHPALKSVLPQVSVGPAIDFPSQNGIFRPYMLQWIKRVRNEKYDDAKDFENESKWQRINNTYITKGIPFNQLDSLEGHGRDTIFQRWLQHPSYDSYWQNMTPTKEEFSKINIPILTCTGYFDIDQRGALNYYNIHNRYGPKEAVKNHYLFIGPFDHVGAQGFPNPDMPPYTIDTAALVNQIGIIGQWFDYTLKGAKKPDFLKDRVAVFAMGENKWHYFSSTANMNKDTLHYFLKGENEKTLLLTTDKAMVKSAPLQLQFTTVASDNDTLHMYNNNLVTPEIFKIDDKLVFKTAPLNMPYIINGNIAADMYLSLSAPDADIAMSWWEEDSNGKLWPLSQNVQRLSYSQDKSKRMLWQKNKVYHVTIGNAFWITKQLSKGSKLVMTLAPLSNIDYEKNYGSGKDVSTETAKDGRSIQLQIHTGKQYPSCINVPVM